MKKTIIFWVLGSGVILLDQIVKYLIRVKYTGGFLIFPGLKIEIYKNKGIAFGFSLPYFVLYLLVILILAFCFLELRRGLAKKNLLVVLALTLVISGAISNLIDRIFLGYILDIFHFLPTGLVFNLADVVIVLGVFLLLYYQLKIKHLKTKNWKLEIKN